MELWLDANGIAGVLGAALAVDLTVARRECGSCGQRSAGGAHRAYRGAGYVLRCPACGDLAARVAELPDRYVVELSGRWVIEVATETAPA